MIAPKSQTSEEMTKAVTAAPAPAPIGTPRMVPRIVPVLPRLVAELGLGSCPAHFGQIDASNATGW